MKRAFGDADMDSAPRYWRQVLLLLTAALALTAGAARGEILYDNTQNAATNNHFKVNNEIEIGDEVLLNGPTPTNLTRFAFEYYGIDFSGNEQARLRFYRLNQIYFYPEALIFDSGWIGISPAPEGATLQLTDFITGAAVPLTNNLPVDFVWSVEFQGVETNEQAGLLASGPVSTPRTFVVLSDEHCYPAPLKIHLQRVTGQSADKNQDYIFFWLRVFGSLERVQAVDNYQSPITINFRARIEGEAPENPSLPTEGTSLVLSLTGEAGQQYQIQTSTDLTQWSALTTNVATSRGLSVSISASNDCRFYRALLMR